MLAQPACFPVTEQCSQLHSPPGMDVRLVAPDLDNVWAAAAEGMFWPHVQQMVSSQLQSLSAWDFWRDTDYW